MDLPYLFGLVLFLAICIALTHGCERLRLRVTGGRS
jgi:hypothetical protein